MLATFECFLAEGWVGTEIPKIITASIVFPFSGRTTIKTETDITGTTMVATRGTGETPAIFTLQPSDEILLRGSVL